LLLPFAVVHARIKESTSPLQPSLALSYHSSKNTNSHPRGPTAGQYTLTITILGAINTVIAGVLALIKGQGLPERLRHDRAEFRQVQDWIEQTEALLAVGIIGRNRKEVGLLVQVAFLKYNAAKQSEENNVPENYTRAPEGHVGKRGDGDDSDDEDNDNDRKGGRTTANVLSLGTPVPIGGGRR